MGFFGDVVDFFQSIGDFLGEIASGIIDALSDLADIAYDALTDALDFIEENWEIVLISAAAITLLIVGPELVTLISELPTTLLNIAHGIEFYLSYVAEWIHIFLETIHFSAILAINTTLSIFWPTWRELNQRFYNIIARVSGVVFKNVNFLNLALRNARTLWLSASASIGREYDLAELEWFERSTAQVQRVVNYAWYFENHPERLLVDLDEHLIKTAHNVKANSAIGVLSTLESLAEGAAVIGGNVQRVSNDFQQLVADLPSDISKKINDVVGPSLRRIDDFIIHDFTPNINRLNGAVDLISKNLEDSKRDLTDLAIKVRNPGDYIETIYNIPGENAERQEVIISNIAFQPVNRQRSEFSGIVETLYERLGSVEDFLNQPVSLPDWHINEAPIQRAGEITPQRPRDSWFVGDY